MGSSGVIAPDSLANEVARRLMEGKPDRFAGMYAYNHHCPND
ncbi:MAG: hypothetical protein R3C11_16800 [Planctomycetaceae bacterium]